MFNLGFGEILIICAVLIIVVGPERLPTLMKNVGKTLRTVRQASRELQETVGLDQLMNEDITRPLPPPKPRLAPGATVARPDPVSADPALPAPADSTAEASSNDAHNGNAGAMAVSVEQSSITDFQPPLAAQSERDELAATLAEPAPQAERAPTQAELDEQSISDRMLALHTRAVPLETPEAPADEAEPASNSPAVSGNRAGDLQSGGGKGAG